MSISSRSTAPGSQVWTIQTSQDESKGEVSLRTDETWCANPSAWPGAKWISSSIYGQREYAAAAIEPHEEHFNALIAKLN